MMENYGKITENIHVRNYGDFYLLEKGLEKLPEVMLILSVCEYLLFYPITLLIVFFDLPKLLFQQQLFLTINK